MTFIIIIIADIQLHSQPYEKLTATLLPRAAPTADRRSVSGVRQLCPNYICHRLKEDKIYHLHTKVAYPWFYTPYRRAPLLSGLMPLAFLARLMVCLCLHYFACF